MMQYLEIALVYILRVLFRVFYVFPIKRDKIVFICYKGRQFSCNPKYIFEYMMEHYDTQYEYVWCLNNKSLLPNEYLKKRVKTSKYLSSGYIYHIMTAGFIINNSGSVDACFPARKSQIIVNTHHGGGAYKKSDHDSLAFKKRMRGIKSRHMLKARMTSYVISSCEKFTRFMSVLINVPEEKFLSIGMPRNDILFFDMGKIKQKVYEYYHINKNAGVVLYAPTYRGDHRFSDTFDSNLDIEEVKRELTEKYNKDFVFFYRIHHSANRKNINFHNAVSVFDYPDMQELLCAADVLITDYSSSIWDFSFTHKPCFLYTPDLKKYEAESGFLVPIKTWPFPLAEINKDLIENIRQFDSQKYINDVNKHHADLESYETGHATEQLCKILFE